MIHEEHGKMLLKNACSYVYTREERGGTVSGRVSRK